MFCKLKFIIGICIVLLILFIIFVIFLTYVYIVNRPFIYYNYKNVVRLGAFNYIFDTNEKIFYLNYGYWYKKNKKIKCLKKAQENMYNIIFKKAQLNKKKKILEIGCGYAEHYNLWRKKIHKKSKIICIDISKDAIDYATKRFINYDNIKFLKASSENLPKKKFNRILAIECAFHFPQRNLFFKNCFNNLKKNGKLIITDIIQNNFSNKCTFMGKIIKRFFDKVIYNFPSENLVSRDEYYYQLKEAGFKKIIIKDITKETIQPFYQSCNENIQRMTTLSLFLMPIIKKTLLKNNFYSYLLITATK